MKAPLQVRRSERLRGDIHLRPSHIFYHAGWLFGRRFFYEVRAWRQTVGAHLNWGSRFSAFGWQVRFEGNSTTSHPKFRSATPRRGPRWTTPREDALRRSQSDDPKGPTRV